MPEEEVISPEEEIPAGSEHPEAEPVIEQPLDTEKYEKRINDLMSNWQKEQVRTERLEAQIEELRSQRTEPAPSSPYLTDEERQLETYIDGAVEKKLAPRIAEIERRNQDLLLRQEVREAKAEFSDINEDEALQYALTNSSPGYLMPVKTAFKLMHLERGQDKAKEEVAKEMRRKKEASSPSGSGAPVAGGIKHYNPATDTKKSYLDLYREGVEQSKT